MQTNLPNDNPMTSQYVYALGTIQCQFPSYEVEKEYAQATGRAETAGLTDRAAAQAVLSQRENLYLVRELCWVFSIEGVETYILRPSESVDWPLLIESLRPRPSPMDLDVIIGVRGPPAPEMYGGLTLPIVVFHQIFSFDRKSLIDRIPPPKEISSEDFPATVEELFDKIMQIADQPGSTDAGRALTYVALRDPIIYAQTAKSFAANFSLTSVEVRPSALSVVKKLVQVIFRYTHRASGFQESYSLVVNVTGEWPSLEKKLSPYYDRP
jgi:hypothetical protein